MNNKPLVVITGASSGIGQATAIHFSSKGYPLLLLGRRIERLRALNLSHCLCKQVDVTDYSALQAAFLEAEAIYGNVDCVINNAGVMFLEYITEQAPEEWSQMMNTNTIGTLNTIQLVMDKMIKRHSGTIINVGSVAGEKTFPSIAAYCASKFAVHALTESIREEVAQHNVRVMLIAPGYVETELLDNIKNESIKQHYKTWGESIGQVLQPKEIAETIGYAYELPQHISLRKIIIAPTRQAE
jgi:NADP-dependent 3-hydroxy acid dehydrogenase YdfG